MALHFAPRTRWIAFAGFLLAILATPAGAQTDSNPDSSSDPSPGAVGYPVQPRQAGTPTGIDRDLDTSFPKPDSLLPRLKPKLWPEFKTRLYDDYGLIDRDVGAIGGE